jgi:hypothetical protein
MSTTMFEEKENKKMSKDREKERKILADDVVTVRRARAGTETPTLLVAIPKKIVNASKITKGIKLRIFTDGDRIYLEKLGEIKI